MKPIEKDIFKIQQQVRMHLIDGKTVKTTRYIVRYKNRTIMRFSWKAKELV